MKILCSTCTTFVIALTLIWCTIVVATNNNDESTEDNSNFKLSKEDEKLLENLILVIHRNGEVEECGRNQIIGSTSTSTSTTSSTNSILQSILMIKDLMDVEEKEFENKYAFEAMLSAVSVHVLPNDSCSGNNMELLGSGIASYCDGGDDKTPILPEHKNLIPITTGPGIQSLPCHFHTREGLRITSLSMLIDALKTVKNNMHNTNQRNEESEEKCNTEEEKPSSSFVELHLYAVASGRVFMFAPSYIGETFNISHVHDENLSPVSLEVLSLKPRVFEIKNFFTANEANNIIEQLMSESRKSHILQRSTTGSAETKVENNQRTSESGFVTDGNGMKIKRRSFSLLGFDTYDESLADGLQVLRYNQTKAYTPHHDYFDGHFKNDYHDYDSTHVGTNRFATILLYMNGDKINEDGSGSGKEVIDGGETVFPDAVIDDVSSISKEQALKEIRTKYSNVIKPDSWQEKLIVKCKTKLSIRPSNTKAILFYSQYPDGTLDNSSIHAGCPVLGGTKWLANIWVWNGPRNTYPNEPKIKSYYEKKKKESIRKHEPVAPKHLKPQNNKVEATFKNTVRTNANKKFYENAELYWGNKFWAKFGTNTILNANTFAGHEWNVRVNGDIVKEWIIGSEPVQVFGV